MQSTARNQEGGFTLIELIVVVGIIALLITLLVPAFSGIQNKAKVAKTKASYNAIDMGLNQFQSEQTLQGTFPPSRTDNAANKQLLADPLNDSNSSVDTAVTGGHLLVHALVGADRLGTPGFRDLNGNGLWSDDTHAAANGLYEKDQTTYEPKQARYPSSGSAGYVDDKMRATLRTLEELDDRGLIVNLPGTVTDMTQGQPLFTDAWERPILYYRASRAAQVMVSQDDSVPAVFRQEDNALITGSDAGGVYATPGIDFGAGEPNGAPRHAIYRDVDVPTGDPAAAIDTIRTQNQFENSFTRYILDPSVAARVTPVRRDTYLLISAGEDARYGTQDDVVNWERNE